MSVRGISDISTEMSWHEGRRNLQAYFKKYFQQRAVLNVSKFIHFIRKRFNGAMRLR
jgi:hypothetical protein